MKNQVTKKAFIEWYFCDTHLEKTIIMDALINKGEFLVRVEDLYESCGYIPQYICVNNDGDDEYNPSEVELI